MKTIAIIQARLRSTRLVGKVLRDLGDRCVLRWVVDRLRNAKCLDEIVVATSTAEADDMLVAQCRRWQVPCFRGSESDVLGRFVETAKTYAADRVVRVNADNPLIDPLYIDRLVDAGKRSEADYQSYRRGDGTPVMLTAMSFFAEVVSMSCLRRADREIDDPFEREHVTLGIYTKPEQYDVCWLDVPSGCNDPRLRLTLDTSDDLALLRTVFSALGPRAESAGTPEILDLIHRHPEWLRTMVALNHSNPKTAVAA